jgi:DNA-binding response OmpR family regulator
VSPAPASVPRPVALVIEDDQDTSDLLVQVLTSAGFSVLTADNGTEGIRLADEHRPALATVDISMPGMDGLEATRQIRRTRGSHTYIVIVSTLAQEDDVLAGFEAGADDYIPKPIRPRELQARLAAVARRAPSAVVAEAPEADRTWALADADHDHAAQLAAGAAEAAAEAQDGLDGREGMLEIGMQFVGSWIEFRGLRINPARGIVVVDDRLIDLQQEDLEVLETLLYCGTRTLSGRALALRVRKETERGATVSAERDREWIAFRVRALRTLLGESETDARWFEESSEHRYRLVRP